MLQSYLLQSHALLTELPKVRYSYPSTIIHRLVQNALYVCKIIFWARSTDHSSAHFTYTLDSMPECHLRFLNEQKQALGDLKSTKRGRSHLTWWNFEIEALKCLKFSFKKKKLDISTALLESVGRSILGPGRIILPGEIGATGLQDSNSTHACRVCIASVLTALYCIVKFRFTT